jgi:hypothetical protein
VVDSVSITNEYREYFLRVKAVGAFFLLLYLLACPITLYSVTLHAIYIEFTVVIFTLIIGYFCIVCMFLCIFFSLYLVVSYLFPIVHLVVFQSLLIL